MGAKPVKFVRYGPFRRKTASGGVGLLPLLGVGRGEVRGLPGYRAVANAADRLRGRIRSRLISGEPVWQVYAAFAGMTAAVLGYVWLLTWMR